MALSPAHTDDDRPGVVPIHDDSSSSQGDSSSNSASAETSSSTSTRFVENKAKEEKGVFLHNKSTITPPSQIQSRLPVGEQVKLQWEWEWEEKYGNLTGEEKKWVTVSLLDDDDDDDDFIGDNYRNAEGCGKQTVETCAFVSQPLLHFLCYFLC